MFDISGMHRTVSEGGRISFLHSRLVTGVLPYKTDHIIESNVFFYI